MKSAISIQNLSKFYSGSEKQKPVHALKNINLEIPKGQIFGLLGPNGAGKSTLINILASIVVKSEGEVKINNFDLIEDWRAARKAIGIVSQEVSFDPYFSPYNMLEIQAGYYGISPSKRKTKEILKFVGLEDKAHAHARSLSGGMHRRLMVAKAMVHSPPILVLDEPTAGVDVALRRKLWENIRRLNEEGVTIILTTHYLEEAEQLCDEMAIICKGEIKARGTKEALFKLAPDACSFEDLFIALTESKK